jgi:hypothetical protein
MIFQSIGELRDLAVAVVAAGKRSRWIHRVSATTPTCFDTLTLPVRPAHDSNLAFLVNRHLRIVVDRPF